MSEVTSYGFAVDRFATTWLDEPLDPWERWLVIHGGELFEGSSKPRFRKLLVIVARQNGKTHVLKVLALYWLFVVQVKLILGTSTNLDYAREAWEKAVEAAEETEELAELIPKNGIRRANGEQVLKVLDKDGKVCRYKIAASNRKGGRSLTIDRLILDELREHDSWEAWSAAYNAMNARPHAQAWGISNQGDDRAVVLRALRAEVIDDHDQVRPLEERDRRLGLFEWSAPPGTEPDDIEGLCMANPNIGRRLDIEDLLTEGQRAKRNGGEELTKFLTEIMCMRVDNMDPAIDATNWGAGHAAGSLEGVRQNVALCVDVSLDGRHATMVAAAVLPSGKVRVVVVKEWEGVNCMRDVRYELPKLREQLKPRKGGWFPGGPAAALAPDLKDLAEFESIRGEVTDVCMGLAEVVDAGDVLHSGDPMLDSQVVAAEKLRQGDKWRFMRRGSGHCDAVYATAGAVYLARTMPKATGKPRIITASE